MGILDRAQRQLIAKAQPLLTEPVVAAANSNWMVSWETRSSATHHPELAGDLPEAMMVVITASHIYIWTGHVGRITHEVTSSAEYAVFGEWPRTEVITTRLSKEKTLFGKQLPEPYSVQFDIPGHPPAQMAGTQGATNKFLRLLLDPTAKDY